MNDIELNNFVKSIDSYKIPIPKISTYENLSENSFDLKDFNIKNKIYYFVSNLKLKFKFKDVCQFNIKAKLNNKSIDWISNYNKLEEIEFRNNWFIIGKTNN